MLPDGAAAADLPGLLTALADAALTTPAVFASTANLEASVLGGHGGSLLLRLAARSLQVLIGDLARERARALSFDPEPLVRPSHQPGRLEQLITGATPPDPAAPTELSAQLQDVAAALRALAKVPVPDLERMLRATIDASSHRIDPWLVAVPQRRLDTLQARRHAAPAARRLRLGRRAGARPARPDAGRPAAHAVGVVGAGRGGPARPGGQRPVAAMAPGHHLAQRAGREPDRRRSPQRRAPGRGDGPRSGTHRRAHPGHRGAAPEVPGPHRARRPPRLRRDAGARRPVRSRSPWTPTQTAAIAELRAALDTYGDLLVADAVHHLVEGRADIAGQVMDAAAGLSRPPELSLLRTARDGRGISSSVVLALPHVPAAALPAAASERAFVSPAATLDPSAAAALAAQAGAAADWDFVDRTGRSPGDRDPRRPRSHPGRRALAHPDQPAAAGGRVHRASGGRGHRRQRRRPVRAGRGTGRADRAQPGDPPGASAKPARPRRPAIPSTPSSSPATPPRARSPSALAGLLRAQVALLGGDGLGTADEPTLRRLLAACAAWGIAPDVPGPAGPGRLAATARLALPQLDNRLAAAPDQAGAAQLSRAAFLDAAAALVSPTGQLAITAATPAQDIPAVQPAAGLDDAWLTVAAAVRPALARLEAHQLTAAQPFTAWANRAADPWQTNAQDARPLVAIYADPALDPGARRALSSRPRPWTSSTR